MTRPMNPLKSALALCESASNCAMENAVSDSSIQVPSGTERERRIARAREKIKSALWYIRDSREPTSSPRVSCAVAASELEQAARLLRGITND
jgi:hypothetical protein